MAVTQDDVKKNKGEEQIIHQLVLREREAEKCVVNGMEEKVMRHGNMLLLSIFVYTHITHDNLDKSEML